MDTKLTINQIINGINITELIFKDNHFLVVEFIFKLTFLRKEINNKQAGKDE